MQIVLDSAIAGLTVEGVVDLAKERARLSKELEKAEGEIKRIDAKLGNKDFVARAPEEVIDEQREKRAEYEGQKTKLGEALKRLAAV